MWREGAFLAEGTARAVSAAGRLRRGDWLELRAQEKKLDMSGAWWYSLVRTSSGHKDIGGLLEDFKQTRT